MASRFWDLYVGTRRSPRYIPWYVTLLTHLAYVTGYKKCTQTSKIIPYWYWSVGISVSILCTEDLAGAPFCEILRGSFL